MVMSLGSSVNSSVTLELRSSGWNGCFVRGRMTNRATEQPTTEHGRPWLEAIEKQARDKKMGRNANRGAVESTDEAKNKQNLLKGQS